ncbi:AAA family ATPase [Aspergillus sclerotialis]|uniref:AAA family ATPase n=1 Tax=Aspergillus sclerotialis TaxID=2070753 RepID=A0A3A2ZFY7_9EURO|nr:AAA family ATPase [Aspergillus sclerotialis]
MRSKPSSSLQKTYDECYLMCSTANNEDEALRSWRSALETIHYHNAYRLPAKFTPKTETEKALQESIRQLEIQCRDRVDLLQALHESRKDAEGLFKESSSKKKAVPKLNTSFAPSSPGVGTGGSPPGWIGEGTIPAVDYMDLSKPPVMPGRPGLPKRSSDSLVNDDTGGGSSNTGSGFQSNSSSSKTKSRGSSPDKRKPMLTTLRNVDPKNQAKKKKKKTILSPRHKDLRPTASKAAGLAWENTARSPSSEKTASDAALVSSRLSVSSDSGRKELESKYSADDLSRKTLKGDDHDYIPDLHWRVPDMPPRRTPAMSPRVRPSPAGPPPPESRRVSGPLANSPSSPAPTSPSIPVTSSTFVPMPTPSFSPLSNSNDTVRPPSPKPSVPPQRGQPPYPSPSTKAPKRSSRGLESDPEPPSSPRPGRAADPLRKPQANSTPQARVTSSTTGKPYASSSGNEGLPRSMDKMSISDESPRRKARPKPRTTPPSSDQESSGHKSTDDEEEDDTAIADILNKLPKGVDVQTARQILNDIVVRGDEVHWNDIAGLEAAKKALKEAVVYPFLRPDLFSGLREPARGMLLFGPPGTGKTMLARAVATESKSTFFSVSSSTLTSKWHGESEKLVRALFGLAKALAPSIIFVDEIDSLLSARSTGAEHEASRRSKTEFLVQWSDLQRAAAGREQTAKDKKEGDASRVLVLAATNMPWDIDEAARRRFVRRQYIPLPEHHVRALQLENLLSHQVHELTADDIEVLVRVTEGFSGSDITALAKDAAMGPLRNLGEALLHTPMDQIRPIRFSDFEASLYSIRPSVSQDGLKEYEEWAKKFGERGG